MAEALSEMCRWAFGEPGVSAVLAETEKANLASQRVLHKTGFVPFRETETMLWWRLECQAESDGAWPSSPVPV
jgi:RimJ/RimL family protein N-acetyltransferase